MAESEILVDYVNGIGVDFSDSPHTLDIGAPVAALPDEMRRVRLGATNVLLPPNDPEFAVFGRMLSLLREAQHPVYAKVTDRVIEDLRVPVVGRIRTVSRQGDGTKVVQVQGSAARHVLRPGNPDFAVLDDALERAAQDTDPRMLTSTVGRNEIIDLRAAPAPAPAAGPTDGPRLVIPNLSISPLVEGRAVARISQVSRARAEALFALVAGHSCALPRGAKGCIPFLYPKDGCWARAERMCDLLQGEGIRAGKIWAHGNLSSDTPNNEHCTVSWQWHVAPVLRIGNGRPAHLVVLDPALFDAPVSRTTWRAALGGRSVAISITDASVFRQETPGEFTREPRGQMAAELQSFQADLERLAAGRPAPPPYDQCRL